MLSGATDLRYRVAFPTGFDNYGCSLCPSRFQGDVLVSSANCPPVIASAPNTSLPVLMRTGAPFTNDVPVRVDSTTGGRSVGVSHNRGLQLATRGGCSHQFRTLANSLLGRFISSGNLIRVKDVVVHDGRQFRDSWLSNRFRGWGES